MSDPEHILAVARRTLEIELEAINNLLPQINENFLKIIHTIFDAKGRLVVTGIGKSAIIGQKMVSTFNSTGTPALFMHAADAIHGDLGMIGKNDIVLIVSKSGETAEIEVLIPLLQKFGNSLIGLVASLESYLARQSDFVLHTPVDMEADPNNLAPTASTTAQLAMGDAIATALLALRGFKPQDFAQFHPGGSLGKQLYLSVKDLYPLNPKPAVRPMSTVRETIIVMTSSRLGATAVTDEDGKLLGVITDGDLRRMLENIQAVDHLHAIDIMSSNPHKILPDEKAHTAFHRLRENSITQLVVADEQNIYLGMIHLHDLIREGFV